MKKYKARDHKWSAGKIEEIDVERETEQSVWIRGRREAKVTSYEMIFDDWESAHQFLLHENQKALDYAKNVLTKAENNLAKVKEMKKQ